MTFISRYAKWREKLAFKIAEKEFKKGNQKKKKNELQKFFKKI
jgi:hypothetical protein